MTLHTILMRRKLYIGTWIVNVAATLLYFCWLVSRGDESIFFARDGILWLLPVLPLAFVYIYLLRGDA